MMDEQPNVIPRKGGTTSLWLLLSLLLSLLVLPLLEHLYTGRVLLLVGLTTTIIIGAMAAGTRFRLFTLVLLLVALPTAWATLLVDSKPLFVAHCVLASVFFWLVSGVIVSFVIRVSSTTS